MPQPLSTKTEILRNRYKIVADGEEGRRRREKILFEVRRNEREEILMKKRHEGMQDLPPYSDDPHTRLIKIVKTICGAFSNDPSLQLKATTQFRMILSLGRSQSNDNVIGTGVVPRFVEFLKKDDYPNLQFEAAWALSSIASETSEHTKVVTDHNAVPIFVQLINSPNDDVREQAIWAVGTVATASIECRDYVLQCGALTPLLAQLHENTKLSILRTIAWTLSNLFCQPLPPFDQIKPAITALGQVLRMNDEDLLSDACWALYYLTDDSKENIHSFIDAGFLLPRLVELLKHPSPFVVDPALSTITYIASGNNHQKQCVIDCRALPLLANLLTHQDNDVTWNNVKKYACWTISNITAGSKQQIQSVIDAKLILTMVSLARNAEFDIKEKVVYAISNATTGGSYAHIIYLVYHHCIETLCDILECPYPRVILKSLDGLENILKARKESEKYKKIVNSYSRLIAHMEVEKIENLQFHEDNEICEKAWKILERYWLNEGTQQQLFFYHVRGLI